MVNLDLGMSQRWLRSSTWFVVAHGIACKEVFIRLEEAPV